LRKSIARLVPQPGQNTSSHGVPAISAARMVGDHSMSRLAASCSFQRRMTAWASAARGSIGNLPLGIGGNVHDSTLAVRSPRGAQTFALGHAVA
jgi:hypothetical protein